jgi:hypothetical protein
MFFVVAAEEMFDVQHWASSIWLKALRSGEFWK